MRQFSKILMVTVCAVFLMAGSAMAITVDGNLSDWGITSSDGLFTTDSVDNPVVGYANGITYWEENGVGANGYVGPGHGGQIFDIEGLYYTADSSNYYFAAIVGMPAAGKSIDFTGDIYFGKNLEYAIKTSNHDGIIGDLYKVGTNQPAYEYTASNPAFVKTGADKGATNFYYGDFTGSQASWSGVTYPITAIYAIEVAVPRNLLPVGFDVSKIHLTQYCGNDVADMPAAPEPATMLLFGSGLVGLAGAARRKIFKK